MYSCGSVTAKHLYKTFTTMAFTCLNSTSCLTKKKKCSLLQNVAAHDRNSYETRLEHCAAHDWCVWLVLELAVCARRKQGAPQGSVLSPAQTPERGLGGAKGRASESGKTIPKDLQTAKSNTATRKPWPASSENN